MNSDASIKPLRVAMPHVNKTLLIGIGLIGLAILTLLLMPIRPIDTSAGLLMIISTLSVFIGAFILIFKAIPNRWGLVRDVSTLVLAYVLTGYWYLWALAISNGASPFTALPEILFRGFPAMLNYAFKWPLGLMSGL